MPLLKSSKASPHRPPSAPPQPSSLPTTAGPIAVTARETSPHAHKLVSHAMGAKKVPPTGVNIESTSNVQKEMGGGGVSRRRRVLARLHEMVSRGSDKRGGNNNAELSLSRTSGTTPSATPHAPHKGEKTSARDSSSILTATTTTTTTPLLSEAKERNGRQTPPPGLSVPPRPHFSVTLSASTRAGGQGSPTGRLPTLLPPLAVAPDTRSRDGHATPEAGAKASNERGKESVGGCAPLPPLTATQMSSPTTSTKKAHKGTGCGISLPPLTALRHAFAHSPLASRGRSHEAIPPHVTTAPAPRESTTTPIATTTPTTTTTSTTVITPTTSTPTATNATAVSSPSSAVPNVLVAPPPPTAPSTNDDAGGVREYLRANGVPQLFNLLSLDLMRDTPDDIVDYVLQWLRNYRAQLT